MFRNVPIKLLSLLASLCFWFFLVIFQNTLFDVPEPIIIEILNKPDEVEIPYVLPEVSVKVAVPKEQGEFLSVDDFRAYIDLKDLEEGEQFVPVKVEVKKENVRLVSYTPQEVAIALEGLKTSSFQVQVKIEGDPAFGYSMGDRTLNPFEVMIEGPESIVDAVEYVEIRPRLKGNETEDVRGNYGLSAYDSEGKAISHGIKIIPEKVHLKLDVSKDIVEKSIPIEMQYAEDVTIEDFSFVGVEPEAIEVRGPVTVINELSGVFTQPVTLDEMILSAQGEDVEIEVVIPEGVILLEPDYTLLLKVR